MKINSISPFSSVSYSPQLDATKDFATVLLSSISQSTESTPKQPENTTNIYEELSTKYDVRNATFEDIVEISKALHAAGEISFKEVATLTFDYERATKYIKQNAPSPVATNFSMFETDANNQGQRDWIAEFVARTKKDLYYGNMIGHQNKQKIVDILKKLEQ